MGLITTDTFFNGRIQVKQYLSGYRFSIDAVLLAYYIKPNQDNKIIDLGTGCGIIPLILAYRYPQVKIFGIELQKKLANLAALNVEENRMENQIKILYNDLKTLKFDMISGPADIVVCNPPYIKVKAGRISSDLQRAVARHEIKATLDDVIATACRILNISGKFIIIYPAERITDLLAKMRSIGIEPKFLCNIHSCRNKEAKLIIVEGVKGGRSGIKIAPPFVIYHDDGSYTDAAKKIFLS